MYSLAKIVVDSRMLGHSGIGRHLTSILNVWRRAGNSFEPVDFGGPIYGVGEQLCASRLGLSDGVYWVPHYNICVLSAGPCVATVHDVAHLSLGGMFSRLQRVYAWLLLSSVALRCNHVFFDCEFTRREFYERVGLSPRSWSIVHCGVDAHYWGAGHADNTQEPYFLAVGNVKPHKNLIGVLKAFQKLQLTYPNVKLKIVGKTEGFRVGDTSFMKLAAECKGVEMVGAVDDGALRDLYAGAAALVFPSFYEGFGLPPLEAMAAGCPSVVSSTGALREICEEGLGEFCDPYDPVSIAQGMRKLLELSPEDKASWRAKARERVLKFSWERAASHVWGVLQDQVRAPLA